MSDSFADLWNSTAPSKPSQPPQPRTLGSVPPSAQQRRPQTDVFSMLAAASPASSRSVTPSYVATQPVLKAGTSGGIKPVQKTSSSGGDAFSDLFSGSSASSTNGAKLTIAEKAALAEKQRQPQQQKSQGRSANTNHASGSTWDGLDALGNSTFGMSRTSSISPAPQQDDWQDLLAPNAPSASPGAKSVSVHDDDDWGLNDFVSKPTVKQPSPAPVQSQSLWSLEEFASSPGPAAVRVSPAPENGRSSTPGSFDFGDREDGLLEDHSGDEDDILGALAKPPQPRTTLSVSKLCPRTSVTSYIHAIRTPPPELDQPLPRNQSPQLLALVPSHHLLILSVRSLRWASRLSKLAWLSQLQIQA